MEVFSFDNRNMETRVAAKANLWGAIHEFYNNINYSEQTADEIAKVIVNNLFPLFRFQEITYESDQIFEFLKFPKYSHDKLVDLLMLAGEQREERL